MEKNIAPQSEHLFQDACAIIEQARALAFKAINDTLIKRNWLLGMRIQHEVLKDQRAEYGEQVVKNLAKELTELFGSGYSRNNLYRFISFHKSFPCMFQSVDGKFDIVPSVMGQSEKVSAAMGLFQETDIYSNIIPLHPLRLSWTHYSIILQESNANARAWYEQEAANEMWSTRTLQRNVSSQYYHRLLLSQDKTIVRDEMKALTAPLQDKLEFMKNPVIAEFLGFKNNTNYTESNLNRAS